MPNSGFNEKGNDDDGSTVPVECVNELKAHEYLLIVVLVITIKFLSDLRKSYEY